MTVIDEIRALLGRHLPGHEVRSVAKLGEGSDNLVYEVNGDLIIRCSKEADPADRAKVIRREAGLLGVLPGLCTLPVPEPVFADVEAGVLAYRRLPGVPLNEHPVADPARPAAALGEFLGRLHRAPVERMGTLVPQDTEPLPAWLQEAEQTYRRVAGRIPPPHRRPVEDFLGRTPPAEPRALVFCHNDLGSEHVLVDAATSTVTGVIDWTDAAVADPVYDLALIYRDLGPDVLDLTLAHYDRAFDDADRERAAFYARCALIEDIAYGFDTGARHYAEAGLAHLARTFA